MKLDLRDTCFLCYDDGAVYFCWVALTSSIIPSHQAKTYYVFSGINTYGMLSTQFLDQDFFSTMQSQEHTTTRPRAGGEDLALAAEPDEIGFLYEWLLQSHWRVVMI